MKENNSLSLIIVLLIIFNSISLRAHNINNGGCKSHCLNNDFQIEPHNNKYKFKKYDSNIDKENNSCLKKSLCRG